MHEILWGGVASTMPGTASYSAILASSKAACNCCPSRTQWGLGTLSLSLLKTLNEKREHYFERRMHTGTVYVVTYAYRRTLFFCKKKEKSPESRRLCPVSRIPVRSANILEGNSKKKLFSKRIKTVKMALRKSLAPLTNVQNTRCCIWMFQYFRIYDKNIFIRLNFCSIILLCFHGTSFLQITFDNKSCT